MRTRILAQTELGRSLHHHTILLVELVVVRHISPVATEKVQGLKDKKIKCRRLPYIA